MQNKPLSDAGIQKAIKRISNPKVNIKVWLASTPGAARKIIELLPGVRDLVEGGPKCGKAVLNLLLKEETMQDQRLAAISLHILQSYPTDQVRRALATPISLRRFTGLNAQLAAEAFLTAAGMKVSEEQAIAVALREAKKLVEEGKTEQK